MDTTCPYCKINCSTSDYFCPNCGKKLKDKPPATTFGRQFVIYLTSFFLPPLGIWPAVRYLRQKDAKSKKIGMAALILTIVSIAITIWLTLTFMKSFNNQLNNQIDFYNGI